MRGGYTITKYSKTHWHFSSSTAPKLLMARAPAAELGVVYRRKNILAVCDPDASEVQTTLYNVPVMLFTFVGCFMTQDASQVLNVLPEIGIGSPVHSLAGKHQPSKLPAAASPVSEIVSETDSEKHTRVVARRLRMKISPAGRSIYMVLSRSP
jgi:hypothetical protein